MASMMELLSDPTWSDVTAPIMAYIDRSSFEDCLWSTDPKKAARWQAVLSYLVSVEQGDPAGHGEYAQMRLDAAIGSLLWFDSRLKETTDTPRADCSHPQSTAHRKKNSASSVDFYALQETRSPQGVERVEPTADPWDASFDVAQILGIHVSPQCGSDYDSIVDSGIDMDSDSDR